MNDKADFDRMFKEWYGQFFYYAYHILNDEEVCKDVVSAAFEYLWRNYDKLEETSVKSYLYTFVRTRCIDHLRRQALHDEYVKFTQQIASELTEMDALEKEERIRQVQQALKKLTPYNRHILEQCYIEKKKYQEVAEELNVSVSAIHKNIVKALHFLRKELGQEGDQDEP